MWHLRSLPRVKEAFAMLWGTDDLLTSFDGSVVFRSQDPTLYTSEKYWLHVDQSPRATPGFDCIQGMVHLTETSPEVGGPVLVPGSHKLYPHWYESRFAELLDNIPPGLNYFAPPRGDEH